MPLGDESSDEQKEKNLVQNSQEAQHDHVVPFCTSQP